MTDEEILALAEDFGPKLMRLCEAWGMNPNDPEDLKAAAERLLIQGGFQLVDGVWRAVEN